MSRIGNKLIALPEGVSVEINGQTVTVKGPKGSLTKTFKENVNVKVEENNIVVTRINDEKASRQLHGTTRALLAGMVEGVSKGYEKELVMKGTGYKAVMEGTSVVMYVGYSHPIKINAVEGVTFRVGGNNNTSVFVSGIDKQAVGQLAAQVRATRLPEPYLGKGVAYKGEHIRRKEGKKAGKK